MTPAPTPNWACAVGDRMDARSRRSKSHGSKRVSARVSCRVERPLAVDEPHEERVGRAAVRSDDATETAFSRLYAHEQHILLRAVVDGHSRAGACARDGDS